MCLIYIATMRWKTHFWVYHHSVRLKKVWCSILWLVYVGNKKSPHHPHTRCSATLVWLLSSKVFPQNFQEFCAQYYIHLGLRVTHIQVNLSHWFEILGILLWNIYGTKEFVKSHTQTLFGIRICDRMLATWPPKTFRSGPNPSKWNYICGVLQLTHI